MCQARPECITRTELAISIIEFEFVLCHRVQNKQILEFSLCQYVQDVENYINVGVA